jgi:hypothetical protein
MPVKSPKQYGLFQAKLHGTAKGLGGPTKKVAREFIHETSHDDKSKFAKALNKKKKVFSY